jgi:hypothetical protein
MASGACRSIVRNIPDRPRGAPQRRRRADSGARGFRNGVRRGSLEGSLNGSSGGP